MRIRWTTLNETSDAEGFLLVGEASFKAERELLDLDGLPGHGKGGTRQR